ncbi:TonB-dependent receptor domain-containing protein [Reichenbachiella sp.]|uniref:TonB-dependent receptor domain-containing protein n=1 Tax=Reichenbachiella sp. TaxID=2184521 RepID=UPI003BB0EC29
MSRIINFTLLTVCLNVLSITTLIAQVSLSGVVKDANAGVSFANVLLLNPQDSSLVKGAVSDAEGAFKLDANSGAYLFRISSIGYKDHFSTIQVKDENHDLGIILLTEDAEQLEEVVVVADKPIFEQRIDRTVINVQSSITASAGSALDILEKSPGVTVDRSNYSLALAGKSGVRVMINGKISRMPLSAAVQMLEGMNADNVESVELITTPPAKYEAEGDAGLINIVLKQTSDVGTNGSFSLFTGYGGGEKVGGSLNFNHRKKGWNIFGNYSYRLDHTDQLNGNDKIILTDAGDENRTSTVSHRDPITYSHNAQLGFDYQLTKNTLVGAGVTFFDRDWNMDAVNSVDFMVNENPSYLLTMLNHEVNKSTYFVYNANAEHKLGERHTLSAEVDYITFDSSNPTDYQQNFQDLDGSNGTSNLPDIRSSKETPLRTLVPRVDYTFQINENTKLEAGVKGAFNSLDNSVQVIYVENGATTIDPDLTREVDMTEDILAAYSSISFKATEKLGINLGLRYEHTTTDLDSRTEQNVVNREYGQWFPSVFINKTINDNHSWVLSYSRRVTRPTFNEIAPFVIFMDPTTFWTGNEALLPAITNNFKAEYRWKSTLISAQYSRDEDAIVGFQPRLADNGRTQLVSAENMNYRDNYSGSITVPITVTDWWEMQYTVTGIYSISETDQLDTPVRVSAFNARFNGSNTFTLPKNFTFEVSAFMGTPSYFGISKFQSYAIVNFGLEKKLKDDQGSFKLSLTDAFSGRDFKGETLVPEENLNLRRRFRFENQVFNLTYTRSFGNNKLKKRRNKAAASQEEQRRIQN